MLWVAYGLLIHAMPVVVANLIVATLALYSSFGAWAGRSPRREPAPEVP